MREQTTPGGLIILVIWGFISYLFGFPLCLLIFFVGAVVIFGLIGLAEYAAEGEKRENIDIVEEELPQISESKKEAKSSPAKKHRPKIRIELENNKNDKWGA